MTTTHQLHGLGVGERRGPPFESLHAGDAMAPSRLDKLNNFASNGVSDPKNTSDSGITHEYSSLAVSVLIPSRCARRYVDRPSEILVLNTNVPRSNLYGMFNGIVSPSDR